MELEKLSAVQLGSKVRNKEISPVEVIDYFEKRIEKRNPSINAFTYTKFDEAREEAKKLEEDIMKGKEVGLFAGVPVALKDFLPTKKGWTASHGGVPSLITVDEEDSQFYSALHKLGAIAVGKTNAPAFGFRGTTDNIMYGPTSTPFNTDYNSGGSSGGSAAAVADGLVGCAEGGDAGGSIRIPAAWCGTFGFKPSAGVVPSVCRPDAWTATHPYCCGGPETRTVRDAAIIMDKMARYDRRDPLSVPLMFNFVTATKFTGRRLKIGYTFDFNIFPEPESEIISAMQNVVTALTKEGHDVELVTFKFNYSRRSMEEAWLRGISIDTAVDMEIWREEKDFWFLRDHHDEVPKEFVIWAKRAIRSSMMDYRRFHDIRTDILDAHLDVFDQYDIILAPVAGCYAPKNADDKDTRGPKKISDQSVDDLIGFAYTYLENMTGMPAASVPIGTDPNGVPIGMQVIAPRYRDEDVFTICARIEDIVPWSYDVPFNRM